MARKDWTNYDQEDGFDASWMKAWIEMELRNGATKKRIENAAFLLDVPSDRESILSKLQRTNKPDCILELARILIDPSFDYIGGRYYQYMTDDGRPLLGEVDYGG